MQDIYRKGFSVNRKFARCRFDPQLVQPSSERHYRNLVRESEIEQLAPASICACGGADHAIAVRVFMIKVAVAVGATVAFAPRRTTFAAWFCENGSRFPPARRTIVDLDALAVGHREQRSVNGHFIVTVSVNLRVGPALSRKNTASFSANVKAAYERRTTSLELREILKGDLMMLTAYRIDAGRLRTVREADPIAAETVWFDLLSPTRQEETALEAHLGLGLPTKDEMQEIEQSSRLYSEDGGHFMTALIPSHTDADDAIMAPVSFILANHRLVTIRYTEPRAFAAFPQRAEKADLGLQSGETVLMALLEAIVDRLADILERAGREIDLISRRVLGQKGAETRKGTNYKATLEEIGRRAT